MSRNKEVEEFDCNNELPLLEGQSFRQEFYARVKRMELWPKLAEVIPEPKRVAVMGWLSEIDSAVLWLAFADKFEESGVDYILNKFENRKFWQIHHCDEQPDNPDLTVNIEAQGLTEICHYRNVLLANISYCPWCGSPLVYRSAND